MIIQQGITNELFTYHHILKKYYLIVEDTLAAIDVGNQLRIAKDSIRIQDIQADLELIQSQELLVNAEQELIAMNRLKEITARKIANRNALYYALIALIGVLAFLLISMYRSASLRRFAERELLLQKNQIEYQNKKITDHNDELIQQNKTLKEQSNELETQNDHVKALNKRLELDVSLRTEKINQQNKELTSLAYHNAHLVRAPLMNVLSLVDLLKITEMDDPSRNGLVNNLRKSIDKLSKVILEY